MGQMIKQETHSFEYFGDDTVSTAAQCIARLPNGWRLLSLKWSKQYSSGSWIAVVQGPRVDVD